MTHIGKCLTAMGIKPVVSYQHKFATTYLYGSYSPIDGDSFVYEIETLGKDIFHQYLKKLSEHRPDEYKIVVIDNAGFHSTKDMQLPENIYLLPIPPYTPELNPCEKVWQYIKDRYKNKTFKNMGTLRKWLYDQVNFMSKETIQSITHYKAYLDAFNDAFYT
jgi:transposase